MILEFLMAFSISEITYSQQQQGCEGGQTGGQFSAFVVSACNNCHEPMARLRTASAAKSVRFMCFHLLSFLFKILKRFTAWALIRANNLSSSAQAVLVYYANLYLTQ